MTARQFVLVLATIVGIGGTGAAAPNPPAKHKALSGGITAEVPVFIPIGLHGCKRVLFHPGEHHLTGTIEGEIKEDGWFIVDQCTGNGIYYVVAEFTGTVLGSEPGTATFTADGLIRNSTIIDKGDFTLDGGAGGLAGVNAVGTFHFTMGVGGEYVGTAFFDHKSK